ncbi:COMPASS (complex proteins associated with Set1p) component [Turnera subulata]|uniref:COMPASS (Complex proteins associated with Set1p) component n=1 Tax=Turnera subulata TaxID=218843 RepID=A0A9Q0FW71_9ROSI|nr:COMPASS (complex proteins associated with Set1p) component [Turnera subulata]
MEGIFVALVLRFDVSRGKESQYFKSAFLGYTVGLVLTTTAMKWLQAPQSIEFVESKTSASAKDESENNPSKKVE